MTRTIEVKIDDSGTIRAINQATSLPRGRASLVWHTESVQETMLLSEASLAMDWLKPEEDAAWAYVLPDR